MWAVGCIAAELFLLKPLFKGEEAQVVDRKVPPFQVDQLSKILDINGSISKKRTVS
jgi:cyclin-dependent kinase 8/11